MRLVVSFLFCGLLFLNPLVFSQAQKTARAGQVSPQPDHVARQLYTSELRTRGLHR